MYFDTNQINKVLICKNCEAKLDIPKCLPCGEVVCSICALSIKTNDNKFDCLLCQNKHEMPKDGLPTIKPFLELLSIDPTKVSRGEAFDLLEKLLNEIEMKQNFIKICIENSTDLVKEHSIELRNNVQLTAEEAISQINDLCSKVIEEIDEYEQEMIRFNNTNSKSLDVFKNIVKDLESFHIVNSEYLKQHVIDDELVNKSNGEAANLIKKAELEIQNIKDIIFDGKTFIFEKNKNKINKSILGVSKMINNRMDSVILKGKTSELMSLCEFQNTQKWTLIYRASQDGFEVANFHSKCNNKPNTLVIIKSENGNIFGGYTEQSWSGEDCFKTDQNAFIFSLSNKLNKPIKMKWSSHNSIYSHTLAGPTFGGGFSFGSDIYIADKSNLNTHSDSHLGHSYIFTEYINDPNEANSFLAGSHNFRVADIEVYIKE